MKCSKRILFSCLAVITAIGLLTPAFSKADDLTDKLQSISVTVKSNSGSGSGTLFVRKTDRGDIAFCWSAAHVVRGLRSLEDVVDTSTGTTKKVVRFADAEIVQELTEDGRRIGEIKMDAEIIRYSDSETGHDLVLLRVRKKNFVPLSQSAVFYLDDKIPSAGTELYHVGSLLGQVGANSLTTGIVSQVGRVLKLGNAGVTFDQTTCAAFPGSSGGGVYLKSDGRYVAMIVRGAGETFNLTVPVRRMREWARSARVEFAIDPSIPVPSEDELKKIPVEDSGLPASISSEKKPDTGGGGGMPEIPPPPSNVDQSRAFLPFQSDRLYELVMRLGQEKTPPPLLIAP